MDASLYRWGALASAIAVGIVGAMLWLLGAMAEAGLVWLVWHLLN